MRFTLSGSGVYCLVMGEPSVAPAWCCGPSTASRVSRVRLVGTNDLLEWSDEDGALAVTLPERLPHAAVTALDLGQGVRARVGETNARWRTRVSEIPETRRHAASRAGLSVPRNRYSTTNP